MSSVSEDHALATPVEAKLDSALEAPAVASVDAAAAEGAAHAEGPAHAEFLSSLASVEAATPVADSTSSITATAPTPEETAAPLAESSPSVQATAAAPEIVTAVPAPAESAVVSAKEATAPLAESSPSAEATAAAPEIVTAVAAPAESAVVSAKDPAEEAAAQHAESTPSVAATAAAPETATAVPAPAESAVVSAKAYEPGHYVPEQERSLAESSGAKALDNLGIYKEALVRLNDQLQDFPLVKDIADRCHVPPLAIVIAGSASVTAFCLWGFCGQLISTMLGVMLPAFESFKCVEEFSNIKDLSNTSEVYSRASSMQFWLIYWVVIATFLSFEYCFYWVLMWIPMYYPTKLAVLLWLYLPQTRGANSVYHWFVAPTLRRNRRQIDSAIDNSTKHLKRSVTSAVANVTVASLGAGAGGISHLGKLSSALVVQGVKKFSGGSEKDSKEADCPRKTD